MEMSTDKEASNNHDPVAKGVSTISNGGINKHIADEGRRVSFTNASASTARTIRDSRPRPSFVEIYTSKRWGITFLALTVLTLNVTLRMGINFALVCMVKPIPEVGNQSILNQSSPSVTVVDYDEDWVVYWDSSTQGQVISAYQIGFPWLCVFGGWAAGKFGGKKILIVMMIIIIIASSGIPAAAMYSPYLVIALRFIVGLSSGGIVPCITQILSRWTPIYERSRIMATANSGQILGSSITFIASGLLCAVPFQNGWPLIFYVFAALNLMIIFVWARVVYDHPDDHPRMSNKEINYIKNGRRDSDNVKMPDPPWRKLLTSSAVWAIHSAHISFAIVFTTLTVYMPMYMNDVMKFDTILNGVASSALFIGRLCGTIVSGYIADKLYISGYLSIIWIRRMFQSIAMIFTAPLLVGISFLDHTQWELAVGLLFIYWFLQGGLGSAFRANYLDIAPRFAGVINGLTTATASASAIASPLIASAVLEERTREEWQIVFIYCAGTGVLGSIIFVCLAQGNVQSWAQDNDTEIDVDETSINESRDLSFTSHDNNNAHQLSEKEDVNCQNGIPRSKTYPQMCHIEERLNQKVDLNYKHLIKAYDNDGYKHETNDVNTQQDDTHKALDTPTEIHCVEERKKRICNHSDQNGVTADFKSRQTTEYNSRLSLKNRGLKLYIPETKNIESTRL